MPLPLRATVLSLALSVGLGGPIRAEAPSLGEGVVVETIPVGNTLTDAGVRPGDLLRAWERLPSPPENPDSAAGELGSPFDWEWMVNEQSMRGTLRLTGEREGKPRTWTVPVGAFDDTEIRPVLPIELVQVYEHGRELLEHRQAAEAIDCWRWLAERFRQAGDWRRETWITIRMASSLAASNLRDAAETSYWEALATARDLRSKVVILDLMSELYLRQGRFLEAEEANLAELHQKQAAWGESLETARTQFQLGWVAHGQGRITATVEALEQVLKIQRRLAPRGYDTVKSLQRLGYLAEERGDLESAERYYREGLHLALEIAPGSAGVASTLNNLGLVYRRRGDLDSAEDSIRQSLQMVEKAQPEGPVMGLLLTNLGGLAMDHQNEKEAEDLYSRAVHQLERLDPDGMMLSEVYESLGEVALHRGDLDGAEEYFRRSLAIMQRLLPVSRARALVLSGLGIVSATRGEVKRAERYLRESLALSERLEPESAQRAQTLHLLAGISRRRGSLYQAREELTQAVEILEAQASRLGGSAEMQGSFRAEQGGIYRDAVRLEVELGQSHKALGLLERFRAQAFLSLLAKRDLSFSSDIPPELDQERRQLTGLYDANELRLATLDSERDRATIETLRREQLHLRKQREEVEAEIRRASPRLAAMIHPETLGFEQVRAALDPGTVMLSYSVGEEETQLFIVTPGRDLAVKTLPVGEEALRREVTHLRQLVEQVRSRSGLGAEGLDWTSRHLYQMLVQPAEPWIAAEARILIVPDGPLHLLPFTALVRGTGAKKGGRDWQYLIEWKPIHAALSGTVYAELKARRREAGDAVGPAQWVGFGDPWFPPRLAEGRTEATGETRLRSFSTRAGLHWQRLPESRREVERIATFFPEAARRVYVDREATEERAKALGRETRIVHFATHGFVDDRSPFDSGLVLAIPEQFTEGHNNGLLQVWEIFQSVRLDADLVVLSACETGLGEVRGGEGIIGLTRAFQYAGARSVLASLWRVDDKATADLMERFYRHLRAGSPKDEALRAAQLEMLARPGGGAAAPYFWASMQLFGDWR